MRALNQIFPKDYFTIRGKCVGLRLILQNIFVFLFLGGKAQGVFP